MHLIFLSKENFFAFFVIHYIKSSITSLIIGIKIVQNLWEGAVAKQILLCERNNIKHSHLCCFPHLYPNLKELTDNHIPIHFDLEKHKDPANDSSHAGPTSHLRAAQMLFDRPEIRQI